MPANKAAEIIDAAAGYGPLKNPIAYADALPDDAAGLKHLLRTSPELATISATYVKSDRLANRAQRWFKWIAWIAAGAGFLAAVLGGLLFYLSALSVGRAYEDAIWLLQYAFLAIALAGTFALGWGKRRGPSGGAAADRRPFARWSDERSKAESARREFYEKIVAPAPTGVSVDSLHLSLQLECFRRYLLEDQLRYFTRRGGENKVKAAWWTAAGIVATTLIFVAAAPMLAYLAAAPALPEWVREVLAMLPLKGDTARKTYWLVGLIGGHLQAFHVFALLISQADRNAEKFAAMQGVLTLYVDRLPEVRAGAAQGNQALVTDYTRSIQAHLAVEANDWRQWQRICADRLETAFKVTPTGRTAPPSGGGAVG